MKSGSSSIPVPEAQSLYTHLEARIIDGWIEKTTLQGLTVEKKINEFTNYELVVELSGCLDRIIEELRQEFQGKLDDVLRLSTRTGGPLL